MKLDSDKTRIVENALKSLIFTGKALGYDVREAQQCLDEIEKNGSEDDPIQYERSSVGEVYEGR